MDGTLRQELTDLAGALAEASPEVLRVAYKEDGTTTGGAANMAHFLQLNGKKLGCDIEQYCFSGENVEGWQGILLRFLEEVVLPLEDAAPAAYAVACGKLIEMGKKAYPAGFQPEWEKLLAPLPAS